jgi:hypothetical protein
MTFIRMMSIEIGAYRYDENVSSLRCSSGIELVPS